jgi:hypothetical protein
MGAVPGGGATRGGDDRRDRQDHAVVRLQPHRLVEAERHHVVARQFERTQPPSESDRHAVRAEIIERRRNEGRPQPVARDQRPARAAACPDGLAQHRAGERGRALGRRRIERRQQQRPEQAVIQRPAAGHDVADRGVARRPQETRVTQIVARAGSRHAPP